ncbi:MAG: hypothetical protein WB660_18190 [Candidatus Sulfotelmatobacter sp.]
MAKAITSMLFAVATPMNMIAPSVHEKGTQGWKSLFDDSSPWSSFAAITAT